MALCVNQRFLFRIPMNLDMNEMHELASAMLAVVCAAVMLVAGEMFIQYGSPTLIERTSAVSNTLTVQTVSSLRSGISRSDVPL